MNVNRILTTTLLVSLAALNACNTPLSNADARQATNPQAAPDTADKILVPHASWDCGLPAGIAVPEKGALVLEADIKLDQVYDLGQTQFGHRTVYVVKEGTFTGPKVNGTVMALGLDFQLDLANGATEIEQIFVFKTNDNKYILQRCGGTAANPKDLRMVPDFEAPNGGAYAWMNTGKFVGRRVVDAKAKTMKITVYDVSALTLAPDAGNSVKVTKPAGVTNQSWDYRKAAATEKRGEAIATESVGLAGSTSPGTSKRGGRNIIPITGGNVTGKITGKVLPGGADYQNLSNPMTIDARYLWQTSDGEVIIVRNAGAMGGLVPTFEVRLESKYAWLNTGKYLSTPPGGGAGGGVSLTFYESK